MPRLKPLVLFDSSFRNCTRSSKIAISLINLVLLSTVILYNCPFFPSLQIFPESLCFSDRFSKPLAWISVFCTTRQRLFACHIYWLAASRRDNLHSSVYFGQPFACSTDLVSERTKNFRTQIVGATLTARIAISTEIPLVVISSSHLQQGSPECELCSPFASRIPSVVILLRPLPYV